MWKYKSVEVCKCASVEVDVRRCGNMNGLKVWKCNGVMV